MRQPCGDVQRGDGFALLNAPHHIPRDTSLFRQRIHAHATAFPQLLQATRQALADALGVVKGFIVRDEDISKTRYLPGIFAYFPSGFGSTFTVFFAS